MRHRPNVLFGGDPSPLSEALAEEEPYLSADIRDAVRDTLLRTRGVRVYGRLFGTHLLLTFWVLWASIAALVYVKRKQTRLYKICCF